MAATVTIEVALATYKALADAVAPAQARYSARCAELEALQSGPTGGDALRAAMAVAFATEAATLAEAESNAALCAALEAIGVIAGHQLGLIQNVVDAQIAQSAAEASVVYEWARSFFKPEDRAGVTATDFLNSLPRIQWSTPSTPKVEPTVRERTYGVH